MTAHTSTPSISQKHIQAGYRKPTVEDFDENEEEVRAESRTDAGTSDKYDLSERGDYFASEFDMSTRGSDTTGRDSEQDEPEEEEEEEEEKNKKDEKRRVMKEQAEEFLRAAPEGTSARVRELMEKLARGEEVEDSEDDSEDDSGEEEDSDEEESDEDMDQWEAKTKMAKEVKRRHEEELIKYWLAKITKEDWEYAEEEIEDMIRIERGETRREAELIMGR